MTFGGGPSKAAISQVVLIEGDDRQTPALGMCPDLTVRSIVKTFPADLH